MTRRLVILAALVFACFGSQIVAAAPYEVTACGAAPGGVTNAWKATNTSVGFLDVTQSCPPSTGLVVQDTSSAGLDTPAGATAEWRFDAPPATQVVGIRASRTGFAEFDNGWLVYLRDAAGANLESCQPGPGVFRCDLGSAGLPPGASPTAVNLTGLATASIAFGVGCRAALVCHNASGGAHFAMVAVQAATVVLDDASKALVDSVSGPLRDASGWLRGAVAVTATVSDAGGGVSRVGILVDGQVPAGAAVDLPCDYTRPAPCPATAVQNLTLNTGLLGDGFHSVQVAADDATRPWSGLNRGLSPAWTVQVDNTAPAASGLRVDAPVRPRVVFDASWAPQAPGAGSPVVRAQWRILDGTRVLASGAVTRNQPIRVGGLRVPRAGAWSLRVRLTDAAGNTGPEATALFHAGPLPGGSVTGVEASVVGNHLRIRVPLMAGRVRYQVRIRLVTPAGRRAVARGAWFVRPILGRTLSVPLPRAAIRAGRFRAEWRRVGARRWRSAILTIGGGTRR